MNGQKGRQTLLRVSRMRHVGETADLPLHRGCQTIFSSFGDIVFAGEWDPKALLAALSRRDAAYWIGKRVLDSGANTSGLSIEIARSGARVLAIEPDPYSNTITPSRPIVERIMHDECLQRRLHNVEL
jgi:hypothetical protein